MATKHTNLSTYSKNEIPSAKAFRFGIVVSQWNKDITDRLYNGTYDTLVDCGSNPDNIETIEVPGSFELIYGTKILARRNCDAIICLGSIIQGKTKHFDYVCQAVSNGIKDLNISLNIPIIFGVLTDNTMEQAISRSGGNHGNKGIEAAITAIKMADLNR